MVKCKCDKQLFIYYYKIEHIFKESKYRVPYKYPEKLFFDRDFF